MVKNYQSIYCNHFGKIMFNYTILGLSIMVVILLGTILSAMYFIISFFLGLLIIIASLGTIFVISPNYISNLLQGGESFIGFITSLYVAFPYIFGITCAASLVSLILECVQKNGRSKGRIITSSIIFALTLIVGIVGIYSISSGGALWKL